MPSPLMSPTVRPRPSLALSASVKEKPAVPSKVEPSTGDQLLLPKKMFTRPPWLVPSELTAMSSMPSLLMSKFVRIWGV